MLVGNKKGSRGMALLYKSRDFKKGTKTQHPLHSGARSGMWECPDFFLVSLKGKEVLDTSGKGSHVKYILKMSLDLTRFDYYIAGKYNEEKDQYVPDNTNSPNNSTGLRYDYGHFYASKTFFDAGKNRRILWGWTNESYYKEQDNARGWALRSSGSLILVSRDQLGTYPKEHIQQYRNSLGLYSNLNHIYSRLFATSLLEEPLRWFHSLPKESIYIFDQLQKQFIKTYVHNRDKEENLYSLFGLKKLHGEKLEDFSKKFLGLARKVDNIHQKIVVTAFTNALQLDCKAKEYLFLNKPTTLEEMIIKVNGYIDLESMMSERQKSSFY
ncbi:hypothetical protein GIB67_031783 [Kingdonia uniflora]|uniref:Uncharacterized protein n=1 Tax=Kingdonia uniflora TaxID=39325 RepID=A0A7J7L4L8_9MAGN|nr:hypothetical protein GIB67_031783 [Kingdonia uniflora]